MLAAIASARLTPLSRSNTTGSLVRASTAVIRTRRSGHSWRGNRAATVDAPPLRPRAVGGGILLESCGAEPAPVVGCVRRRGDQRGEPVEVVHDGPGRGLTATARGGRGLRSAGHRQGCGVQVSRCRAGDLRGRGGAGGGADREIGSRHVHTGIEQTGDDADQPGVAGGTAAAEDERSVPTGRGRGGVQGRRRGCVHGSRLSRDAYRALPAATTSVARSWTAGERPLVMLEHGSHLLPVEHDRQNTSTRLRRRALGQRETSSSSSSTSASVRLARRRRSRSAARACSAGSSELSLRYSVTNA